MSESLQNITPRQYAIVSDAYTRIIESHASAREALSAEFRVTHPDLWSALSGMLNANPSEAAEAIRVNHTEEDASLVGAEICDWNLFGLIGKGGFGTVYLVRRRNDSSRTYALKLLNKAMHSAEGRSRFRHELEAQRVMDHPYIPRIVDQGESKDGRPFVVMPFHAGLPVCVYASKRGMTAAAKIELFIKVCEAVSHAHLKGIIHRDLKPDNVLVMDTAEGAVPAVIDFGLAKAYDIDDDGRTKLTLAGQMIGTPEYMSPEQAIDSRYVDARSDQYSLGCILYEMLTGRPPLTTEELRSEGRSSVQRVIAERDPIPPDVVKPQVPRELGWICMKCIEKDPDRRYPTLDALMRDLRAFLSGEAVEAAPPTRTYRVRKLIRRHRTAFLGIAMTMGALLSGGVASLVFAVRANEENERAQQISGFIRRIFTEIDPLMIRGRDPEQMLMMLDAAAAQWKVVKDPKVALELADVFAQAYYSIGKLDQAGACVDRALAVVDEIEGVDSKRKIELIPIKIDVLRSGQNPWVHYMPEWRRLIDLHYANDEVGWFRQSFRYDDLEHGSAWGMDSAAIYDTYARGLTLLDANDPLMFKIRLRMAIHDANANNPACHRQIQEVRQDIIRVLGPEHPLAHLSLSNELWVLFASPLSPKERAQFCKKRVAESEQYLGPLSREIIYAYYNESDLLRYAEEYEDSIAVATLARNRALRAQGPNATIANWIDTVLALSALEANDMESLRIAELRAKDGSNNGRMWRPYIQELVAKLVKRGMYEHADLWIRTTGRSNVEWDVQLRTEYGVPLGALNAQPSN